MTIEELHALKKPKSKYRNVRVKTPDGNYDSKAEQSYHILLLDRERKGQIFELKRQVPIIVIDNPKLVYKADFIFKEPNEAFELTTIVCDVKGDTAPLTDMFKYKFKALKVKYPSFDCRIIRAKSLGKGRYNFREEKK